MTTHNEGFHQTGGTMSIGVAAAGRGARIDVTGDVSAPDVRRQDVAEALEELRAAVAQERSRLSAPEQVDEELDAVTTELEKDEPDTSSLADRLDGISAAAGGVTSVVTAVGALMSAAKAAFGSLL